MTCGILVPGLGIEPLPAALEARSLNHWTAREVPTKYFKTLKNQFYKPLKHHKIRKGLLWKTTHNPLKMEMELRKDGLF